ncbi:protein of unknown function [bacterium A37T11]|nr:protein of unknown function [bacterium A37T11]
MIQRIQSIWLFLAAVVFLGLFLFPYLQYSDTAGLGHALKITGEYQAIAGQAVQKKSFIFQTIITVIIGILPLYTIFLFKNRKKQRLFVFLTITLIILFGVWLYTTIQSTLEVSGQNLSANNIGIGFFLLPISTICLVLALNGIQKDERLIQSANRLR